MEAKSRIKLFESGKRGEEVKRKLSRPAFRPRREN